MASMMVSLTSTCMGSTVLLHSPPSQTFSLSRPGDEKTEERRPSPATDKENPAPPTRGHGMPKFWSMLPAAQDGVRQNARAEQQRGRRQEDRRATAARKRRLGLATRGLGRPHRPATRGLGLPLHHGGVLRQRNGRQDQHDQESGRSQEYRPLHPVLLFYVVFKSACICPSSSREGTHSVQNLNAKDSIILIIFNENNAKRPLKLPPRAAERG